MATILIVDDHPTVRGYLTALLGPTGHRLLGASDGAEALEKVRIERPDLVLSDILMPTMDGYEFVRQLRSDPAFARTPEVVFLTAAYHEQEVRALAEACGVRFLITKPFPPETLIQTVSQALGGPPAEAPRPSETFGRDHLRLLTDKLAAKISELEEANRRLTTLVGIGRRTEKALRDSHAFLDAVLEGIPDAVFVKDRQGRYVMVNSACARFVGTSPKDMVGRTDHDLFEPETADCIVEVDRRVMESGETWTADETASAAGVTRTYSTTKRPYRDAAGAVTGVFGIARDITERRRSEETLRQQAERLQALSRRLVAVQEEERRRMARELHDEIGQMLTGLHIVLEADPQASAEAMRKKLSDGRPLIDGLLTRVRDLSFGLRPALLDHLGLLPALLRLFEHYTQQTGVRVDCRHEGLDRRFETELETAAYRIVQEALTNVARHAAVKEAMVRLWVEHEVLAVQVQDHGAGFDPSAVPADGDHCGLAGVYERVTLLGGELLVESEPGAGTQLTASFPLRKGGWEKQP